MRHVRMLGLCLVAVLAVGAYAVSSASALEWGKCEYVGPNAGKYGGAGAHEGNGENCTKGEKAHPKLTGEYEWRKASEVAEKREAEGKSPNVSFIGASTGKGLLSTGGVECSEGTYSQQRVPRWKCVEGGGHIEQADNVYVECEGETNEGETEGKNKLANVEVIFFGCNISGIPCNSEGAASEEIVVNTLNGKLGWINKTTSPRQVGVLLYPAAGKKAPFAEFTCAEGLITTYVGVGSKKEGSFYLSGGCIGTCEGATPEEEKHGGYDGIISPITPVNEMTSKFEQKFVNNGSLIAPANEPESFEGKHVELLEDHVSVQFSPEYLAEGMWTAASEEVTNVNEPEEEGEIKA